MNERKRERERERREKERGGREAEEKQEEGHGERGTKRILHIQQHQERRLAPTGHYFEVTTHNIDGVLKSARVCMYMCMYVY